MSIEFGPIEATSTGGHGGGGFVLGGRGRARALLAGHGEGRGGFILGMRGLMSGSSGPPEPTIPSHGSGTFYLGLAGTSHTTTHAGGGGAGGFLLDLHGRQGAGGGIALYLGGHGRAALPPPEVYGFMVMQPPVINSYAGLWFAAVHDRVRFADRVDNQPTALTRERFALAAAPRGRFEGTKHTAETVVIGSRTENVVIMLIQEGVVFSDLGAATYSQIARAVSRLLLTGQASHYAEGLALVADALVMGALAEGLSIGTIADQVALAAAVGPQYTLVAAMLDRLLLTAAATPQYTLTAVIEERFLVGANLSHQADLIAILRDSVGFSATLDFDDGQYIAWVLNTESKGLTRYTNYPFNSFAKIGGVWYGATSAGLFEIGGDTDDGELIHARIRLGLSAMGTRKLKRVPEAFIGYSSNGTLLVKVITVAESTGDKQVAIYKMAVRPAAATIPNRVEFGRGLKSVDWDFELENVNGADFDLHSIQFRPLILDRRTRG